MILPVCQILNPDPAAMSKLVSENASEEFLYSLSNYCSMQVRLAHLAEASRSIKLLSEKE
jgi:hypothetical protein